MRSIFQIFFLICLANVTFSQSDILLYLQGNKLVSFDPATCNYTLINNFSSSFTDIALHSDGKMYGIRSNGDIYELEEETGNEIFITSLSRAPQERYTALAASVDGKLYIGEGDGDIVTYDTATGTENFLGNIGHIIEGDLSFRNGVLYAGTTDGIVEIDLTYITLSEKINWFTAEKPVWGINTAYISCNEQLTYVFTGLSRPSIVYSVNIDAQTSAEVCRINEVVYGSTSEDELKASYAIDVDLTLMQPGCDHTTGSAEFTINQGDNLLFSLNGAAATPTTSFPNLSPDDYTVIITDDNGCEEEIDFTIENNASVDIDVNSTNATCTSKGQAEIVINAGENLEFSLNGAAATNETIFTDLDAGNYTIIATDTASNCSDQVDFSIENEDANFEVTTITQDVTCSNLGSLTVTIVSGSNLSFQIDGGVTTTQTIITGLSAGTHTLTVTDTADSCTVDYSFTIEDTCVIGDVITVPTAFVPNGNTTNERFPLLAPSGFSIQILEYKIFNRWGELLYQANDFDFNQTTQYWNGKQDGEEFFGSFLYHIVYQLNGREETTELSGISYVLR